MATGFDSEYYRDDPRAQEVFKKEVEPEEPQRTAPVSTASELEHNETSVVDEEENMRPESKPSDFADATTVNMWDAIRTDNGSTNNDIPAILRRRKKNKD